MRGAPLIRSLVLLIGLMALVSACGDDQPPSVVCCEADERPGAGGSPLCIEGATCCADGTWACNEGDGRHTCDSLGGVCEGVACDPELEPGTGDNPTCVEGASCCPDGEWQCNDPSGAPTC